MFDRVVAPSAVAREWRHARPDWLEVVDAPDDLVQQTMVEWSINLGEAAVLVLAMSMQPSAAAFIRR